ncbi:unnamed protein product, partial [Iphiclides podalirius]
MRLVTSLQRKAVIPYQKRVLRSHERLGLSNENASQVAENCGSSDSVEYAVGKTKQSIRHFPMAKPYQ